MLCGLATHYIKGNLSGLGLAFVNTWRSVLSAAHLYNACSAEKLLSATWDGMELILGLQDTDQYFVGAPPKSPEQYFRRFCLALGWSATNFARNKRPQNNVPASASGPRCLQSLAPVSLLFLQRYAAGVDVREMSEQDVEKILESSHWIEEQQDEGVMVLARQTKEEVQSRLMEKWKHEQRVGIADLLRNLRLSLEAEKLELSFDYFLMHRECWRAMRAVEKAIGAQLRQILHPSLLDKDTDPPLIVGSILMAISSDQPLAKSVRRPISSFEPQDLLEKAAAEIKALIDSGFGDVVMKDACHIAVKIMETRKPEVIQ